MVTIVCGVSRRITSDRSISFVDTLSMKTTPKLRNVKVPAIGQSRADSNTATSVVFILMNRHVVAVNDTFVGPVTKNFGDLLAGLTGNLLDFR